MIASITLLINKPSYAVQIPGTSYCPETITLVEKGNLELIPGLSMHIGTQKVHQEKN